ncbi:MAG: type I 3-dehydroquinate dehydratase [Dissulfurispiraceae bacterium]
MESDFFSQIKARGAPLVAGVLTDKDVSTLDGNSLDAVDVIELRVDMFDVLSPDHVDSIFTTTRHRFRKPLIGTIRDISEGGQQKIDDRLSLYKTIVPLSDFIDVELQFTSLFLEVSRLITSSKPLLIGSYHNFQSTPDDAFLDDLVSRGKDLGADIVKVATMANTREDMVKLLLFTLRNRHKGLITMSLGDQGLPTRVVSPLFGSLIAYGFLNVPSAPGQLSIVELRDIFNILKIR